MTLTQLEKILNERFGYPSLPEGFVRARLRKRGWQKKDVLDVYIGNREVGILGNGETPYSGTGVGAGARFSITDYCPPSKGKEARKNLKIVK